MAFFKTKCTAVEVPPNNTSKTCARCGHLHKGLRGERVFVCPRCGVCLDRQLNAAINIYLKMNGDSHASARFDGWFYGGLPAIGAEGSLSDELARRGEEPMMPKQILIS